MKMIFKLLLVLAVIEVTACGYVEFSRKYEITENNMGSKQHEIEHVLEQYFVGKGLVVIKKYEELYPGSIRHVVLEIPRSAEEKRRDPRLYITISGNHVVLEHNEFFMTVNPFPSMEPYKPKDYIKALTKELEDEIRNKTGIKTKIVFMSKGYY